MKNINSTPFTALSTQMMEDIAGGTSLLSLTLLPGLAVGMLPIPLNISILGLLGISISTGNGLTIGVDLNQNGLSL